MTVKPVEWDSQTLLAGNRQRLLKSLKRKLRTYELRYELSSDRLEAELAAGRLRETAEICDWVIAWRTCRALVDAR